MKRPDSRRGGGFVDGWNVLTEGEFQAGVLELATYLGWRHYHPYDSRRSVAGFPDLTLVRNGRLIFAELKTDKGVASEAQKEWLKDLGATAAEVHLWRPSDWDAIVATLSRTT